jgi:sugar lactone lactonase YvrE
VSDELDEVRWYFNETDPPDAQTMANVQRRLDVSMATETRGASPVRPRRARRVRTVGWATLLVALALGVALFVPTLGHRGGANHAGRAPLRDRLAQLVVDDVNVTVASGSYDMTYSDTTTPVTNCPQPTAGSSPVPSTFCSTGQFASISGHGTVDTNPYAMVTVTDVGSLGTITLYDNGTNVWEIGGGDYGLAGPGQAGPGAPLSGYAGSVEGTLGQLPGALDMQGLASGTGYLDLEAQEIQGAQPAGTGSVDGVPVTIYKLTETGLQDPDTSGLTAQQIATISAADAIIKQSGFAGKTTWISVDSNGYIREQKTEYTLPNGSTVSGDTILSNFGCAGTVLMPGQPGSSAPPSGCVSPDHATTGSSVSPSTSSTSSTSSPSSTTTSTTGTAQASSAVVPSRPTALAVGPNGNLYIADQTQNQILERLPDGTFRVVAGTGLAGYAGDGGPAVQAELDRPGGMAFGADGTLYFADEGNERVRAISPSGTITTVVGTGTLSPTGGFVTNGTPALDAVVSPNDVALGPGGLLYLSTDAQVLRLNADGTLSVVVGTDSPQQGGSGVGGPATAASADGATGLTFDSAGNLYFFGFDAKTVFVVPPSGVLTNPLGDQSIYPHGDAGLATAPDGGVLAMGEQSVVRLSPTGDQTIMSFYPGPYDGITGFSPNGIAIGPDGTIYVDTYYGNGWTDRTAIISISPSGASSQILWEAPMGQ